MTLHYSTDREIAAQPEIWDHWATRLPEIAAQTRSWISNRAPDEIWLCGAGTSAFVGDSLARALGGMSIPMHNIATTDLVARPQDFFRPGLRPLVVSFGRSGNSSESIGTLDLLDRLCPTAERLNITCNKDGALATRLPKGTGEQRVITLPDACHDQGFAMTSSYTTMLLTALAVLGDDPIQTLEQKTKTLAAHARTLLATEIHHTRPKRAVFLGSGPFLGTARESALKILELTAGAVVTTWDSSLGFRHGPKAVVDDQTSVFVYLSADPLTRKYDQDIVDEIRAQFPTIAVTSIGYPLESTETPDIPLGFDDDLWSAPLAIIAAQRLAVAWSKSLGLNVDDPFSGRNLTRVVSHVQLYT